MWRVWALPGWRSRARSWSSRVGAPLVNVLVVAGLAVSLGAARATLAVHADLPSAAASRRRRVLFRNPRSGGGEAERFSLAAEARARGIQPIELKPGTDFETLVREAVDRGADGLAMAGGDGSQAIVAERVLRKVCVPAGTRNHIALDLGVDRDDVVGAPGAFVDGGERTVDLAEVNGRVFVNTISLGLYAEAVQRAGCRDAKLRTLLDTVPDVLGLDGVKLDLRWTGPGGTRITPMPPCWSPRHCASSRRSRRPAGSSLAELATSTATRLPVDTHPTYEGIRSCPAAPSSDGSRLSAS